MIKDYCEIPECTVSLTVPGGEQAYCIDSCIVQDLKYLWEHGIKTVCSCCGHGDDNRAYVRVASYDSDKMEQLGYEPYEPHECVMWNNSKSYRAKYVKRNRIHNKPIEGSRDLSEIRELWRKRREIKGCLT